VIERMRGEGRPVTAGVGSLCAAMALTLALSLAPVSSAHAADSGSYQVGPGDVLQVTFYAGGEKQDDFASTVSSLGVITSPLIGDLTVAGMTTGEIADTMTTLLSKSYFVKPQVLVNVKEYAGQVLVMGAVRLPGSYPFQAGLTALKACVLAGGFTEYATASKVKLTRVVNGKSTTISLNLDKVSKGKANDPELLKGDRIDVGRRRF
jgi:polysaccharide export outer membrane protein